MDKKQAIRQVNETNGFNRLNARNTHWSKIVKYGAYEGWWLNIPFHKFSQGLNLLLNNESDGIFLHIQISANSVLEPEKLFRNRPGKADVFMPCNGADYLIDCQSGSSRHDFSQYPSKEYEHSLGLAQ